jgi:deoxyribose-phosphate aldolase
LKPASSLETVANLCREAISYQFAAVCIPPFVVRDARAHLKGTEVKLATVIGFPMGYSSLSSKLVEIEEAVRDGADELDVVINIIALRNGNWEYLEKEMMQMVSGVHGAGRIIKVIVESGVLANEEIVQCCTLYGNMGIDFMKTSTGYAEKGASVEAVKLMRRHLPASVQIKASGGIKTYEFAMELIDAGATRIGSSAGVAIVQQS